MFERDLGWRLDLCTDPVPVLAGFLTGFHHTSDLLVEWRAVKWETVLKMMYRSIDGLRCLVQLQGTTTTSGGGLIGTRNSKDLGMNFNSQAWPSFRRAVILHHYHCPYHCLDIVNTRYNHITC